LAKNVQVKKANRVITVSEDQVKGYLQRGYDQVEEGKVVKHATGGKNISAAQHQKALDRIKELEAKGPEEGVSKEEFDKLNDAYQELAQENDELKEKAKKFAEKGKALQEENEKLKKQNK
jgi:transcription termination factor Rho